jgi:hypothetical protein
MISRQITRQAGSQKSKCPPMLSAKKLKIKLRKGLVPEKKLKEVPLGGAEVPKEEFFSSRNC